MSKNYPQQIQIIGGAFRHRKVQIPNVAGLRPTPARIRETLFNWLTPYLPGARCLDLFAGSGALGIEALSRGASSVTFIDQSSLVLQNIREHLLRFGCKDINVIQSSIPTTALKLEPFDIIFLDPPFNKGLLPGSCQWLMENGLLKPQALIYIEAEANFSDATLPVTWQILRSKKTERISYQLVSS